MYQWILDFPVALKNLTFEDLTYVLQNVPIWVYGTAGLFLLLKVYMNQKWAYWQNFGIKGPAPSLMAWGNGGLFMEMLANKTDPFEYVEKYGTVSGIFMGGSPMLIAHDAEILKEVNIKQFSKFPRREPNQGANTALGKIAVDFMTGTEGPQWRRQRHTTSPMMSQSKLEKVLPLIQSATKIFVGEDGISETEEYETKAFCQQFTVKAIMSSGFNIDPSDKSAMDEAETHAKAIIPQNAPLMKMILYGMIPESIRFTFDLTLYPKETDKYFRNLINYLSCDFERKQSAGIPPSPDFVSLMLQNSISEEEGKDQNKAKGWTPNEILSNAVLFIIASFETTASVLQFLIYELSKNRYIQEDILKEIKNMENVSYETIRDLKYLDAVIKETMRLYSPVPMNMRYCQETTTVGENIVIEKGTTVVWLNHYFHHNPDLYSEPFAFKPSRWEGNESNTLQDENWFGFGQGPRACPGTRWAFLTMKIMLIELIRVYAIEKCEKTPESVKLLQKGLRVVSDKPMIVKFKRREVVSDEDVR